MKMRDRERAALEVLRSTGVDVLEAALVARAVLECGRGRVRRARECVRLGAEEMRKREKTVTFRKAVEMALEEREKKNRRARSVTDFRYYCKRLMVRNPGLAERRVRSITAEDCRTYLQKAYGESPSQYRKARAILSGVFSTAIRHDWCDTNPVSRVEVPEVVEKPIEPLSIEEVERLEAAAQLPEHKDMQLSLHLMLYCGIRPTEVSRIDPECDIDWQNERVVPLRMAGGITVRTIPPRWKERWLALRRAAGGGPWQFLAAGCLPAHVCHLPRRAFPQLPRPPAGDGA